jgi:hypothetical protein
LREADSEGQGSLTARPQSWSADAAAPKPPARLSPIRATTSTIPKMINATMSRHNVPAGHGIPRSSVHAGYTSGIEKANIRSASILAYTAPETSIRSHSGP